MELGAMVCLPNGKPICDQCPLMHLCKAFHEDKVMQIPVKAAKKERRRENRTILLMEYQNKYAILKRKEKGLLAGLWELPSVEDKLSIPEVEAILKDYGVQGAHIYSLGEAKHIFSHVEWHMRGYHIVLTQELSEGIKENNYIWADREEISDKYSIPNAFSAYTKGVKEYKNR
jgi:A/G-specific adenine glycosylase